jgi:hypothetical protein
MIRRFRTCAILEGKAGNLKRPELAADLPGANGGATGEAAVAATIGLVQMGPKKGGQTMLRCFLICAGAEGKDDSLRWLEALARERRPDGILFAGGILAPAAQGDVRAGADDIPREDALCYQRFFETLGKLGVFTALVPGPQDRPLRGFLRLGMQAEVDFPTLHVVHACLTQENDTVFAGIGGQLTENADSCEMTVRCSRATAEYFLRKLWAAEQPRKVLLLGTAPRGALSGEEGSTVVGDLIDSYHPSLCVVAGPTAHRGTQRIAHTLVINPGRLADGSAAWLDWDRGTGQVELLDARSVAGSTT